MANDNTGVLNNGCFIWGKHKGEHVSVVDAKYLEYIIGTSRTTIDLLQAELDRRKQVEEANLSVAERILQAGYRELSKQVHPDITKDNGERQRELNAAMEALRELLRGANES